MTEASARIRWGWITLILLFAFLISTTLASYLRPANATGQAEISEATTAVRQVIAQRTAMSAFGQAVAARDVLDPIAAKLKPLARSNPDAATLLLVVQREQSDPPSAAALRTLQRGTPVDRAIAQLYGKTSVPPEQWDRLAKQVPAEDPILELVAIQAREASGKEPIDPTKSLLSIVIMLAAVGGLTLGIILLIVFLALRSQNAIEMKGHPMEPLDGARADRLAIRVFQMFCTYLLASLTLPVLVIDPAVKGLALAGFMILSTIALFRLPVAGQPITLREVGITGHQFGRNVVLGFAGYLANLPIMLVCAVVGVTVFRFLPPPQHPAGELLQSKQSPLELVALFVQLSVMAPFWEEICFRGLLFPALSRVMHRALFGALFSSFLFASIHPQGIPAWLALGSVGFMSCVLAKYTKSLVPSMTMHAVHNGVIFTVMILFFR